MKTLASTLLLWLGLLTVSGQIMSIRINTNAAASFRFSVTFTMDPNRDVLVQASTNLADWADVGSAITDRTTTGYPEIKDPHGVWPAHFYRVREITNAPALVANWTGTNVSSGDELVLDALT